jgi:hypothetical protein
MRLFSNPLVALGVYLLILSLFCVRHYGFDEAVQGDRDGDHAVVHREAKSS